MLRWLLLAAFSLAGCAASPADHAVGPPLGIAVSWTAAGLANPESVALSADGRFFYVSNVAGEPDARDAEGYIARVSRDGAEVEPRWAGGLNAPKGLLLRRGVLLVSDIDALVELDASTGAILKRTPIEGAQFLNDVAALPGGAILISDSGASRIYAVQDGQVSVWLADPLLRSVNGLYVDSDRVIAATMQGRLLAIDMHSRAIVSLAEGLGDADGVAPWGEGFIVSEWRGRLFYVRDGAVETLLDTRQEGRLINDFILVGEQVIAPNWEPGALTAYTVRH